MTLKVIFVLVASLAITHSHGQPLVQGQVWFANRVTGVLDAPVHYSGTLRGPGPDWTAQLYLHGAGGRSWPLTPAMKFRPAGTNLIEDQYWLPVTVDVPGVFPGQPANFTVRVYRTTAGSWEAARFNGDTVGESSAFTVTVGGGTLPPANLVNLTPFTIGPGPCPPEICPPPVPGMTILNAGTSVTLGLGIQPYTPNLIVVSTDLKNWRPYLNVFSKVGLVKLSDRGTDDAPQPHLFYRARAGYSESIPALHTKWQQAGITNYTYKFKRTCACPGFILSGTVTVQNGKPISVDAYNDGQPIEKPDLSQFKSIEDLFNLVAIEQSKADVVTVVFDPVYRFPTLIDIDYVVSAADDEIQYWATDVRPF